LQYYQVTRTFCSGIKVLYAILLDDQIIVSCDIMTTITKPKYCGQNWLEMQPTDGGRICGQCDKVIVDFSKMSWTEIEQLQRQNNNAVCGMYNPDATKN